MKKYLMWILLATLGVGVSAGTTSCNDANDPVSSLPGGGTGSGDSGADTPSAARYVIAAQVDGTSYLLTAESLDEGRVTTRGEGTEVVGGTYWVFHGTDYLFALVYNNGGAGTGASYYLNGSGVPTEKYTYEYNRITTYGTWGDRVITVSTGDSKQADADGNLAQALLFNYLDATTGAQSSGSVLAENFVGNGEKVSFAGIVEANDRLYTSVVPMGMSKYGVKQWPDRVTDPELVAQADGGSNSSSYVAGEVPSTQYPDEAWVAIYTGDRFDEEPVIAHTDRIGYACGRMRSQYYQTIWAADNGDLYVFSPGYGRTAASSADLKKVTGTLPSGVVRIRAGETQFDPDYYVNLEAIGTRKPIFRCWHISEDYFLLQLYKDGAKGMIRDGKDADVSELAIFKGEEQSIVPVTGLPDDLAGFGGAPYGEEGAVYMAVTVTGGAKPAFYRIDARTGVAARGLEVDAESVSAVGRLAIRR